MEDPFTTDKKIICIVLAWNHIEDTMLTLSTLLASKGVEFETVLVDNASTDDTVERVKSAFPEVKIIQSDKNLGVSGGYNLGMAYATSQNADYMLVANNDIEIDPEMLANLVRRMEQDPSLGMVMPLIYHYYDDRERYWCTGGHWRSFPPTIKMSNFNKSSKQVSLLPETIDFAPSCILLLSGEAVRKTGMFDTSYFFYYDDWDYSIRMREAGYRIGLVADAWMWHKVSVSTQNSEKPLVWWEKLGQSATIFSDKHFSGSKAAAFRLWLPVREFLKGHPERSKALLSGISKQKRKG